MTDIVHYKIPFWFIGDIANSLIVKGQLKKIFEYREKVAGKFFEKKESVILKTINILLTADTR